VTRHVGDHVIADKPEILCNGRLTSDRGPGPSPAVAAVDGGAEQPRPPTAARSRGATSRRAPCAAASAKPKPRRWA